MGSRDRMRCEEIWVAVGEGERTRPGQRYLSVSMSFFTIAHGGGVARYTSIARARSYAGSGELERDRPCHIAQGSPAWVVAHTAESEQLYRYAPRRYIGSRCHLTPPPHSSHALDSR